MDADSRAFFDAEIAALTPVARPAAPPLGFGRDLLCFNDLDARMTESDPESVESIAQDAWHAIITEKGTIEDAPDFGLGISRLLSTGSDPAGLLAVAGQIDQTLSDDDRIASSKTTATFSDETLRLSIAITPENASIRSFNLIISVTRGVALFEGIT